MMDWMMDHGAIGFVVFMLGIFAAAGALIGVLLAIIMPIVYFGERSSCSAFSQQTGRETRFVHLVDPGIPLSWDCLVKTANGRWISRSQLRSVDES